jgi:accessory gene regulator protein AgrB
MISNEMLIEVLKRQIDKFESELRTLKLKYGTDIILHDVIMYGELTGKIKFAKSLIDLLKFTDKENVFF